MTGEYLRSPSPSRAAAAIAILAIIAATAWLALSNALGMQTSRWTAAFAAVVVIASASYFTVAIRRARRQGAELSARCAELQQQLECDPLTSLMNRSAFNKALANLPALDSSGGSIMVLFFDLDRFKEVNDTLGHKIGDQLLIEVAARAGNLLGDAIAFARLGGDEFAAILPIGGSCAAQALGESIVDLMKEPFVVDHHSINIAASVGIALGDAMLDEGHELLRRADAAMYEAKGAARGGCHIYDDMLSGRQLQESFVRVELGKALVEQSLSLNFQPLVDARTGLMSSAEALLRPTSASLRDVDTATLIAIAEKSGQILPLTDWTMGAALTAIADLESVSVALNVSPIYFRKPDFVQSVLDRLLETGTSPELLTIEITENVLISDVASARASIAQLRDVGVKVFLDDFGTAYSSLSYLQHFELDGLKLDKSFLRDIGDRKKATRVVKSMVDFGHSLDMRVVMEGVESEWQVRLLQLLGCDLLQGYELGVPMKIEELRSYRNRPLWTPVSDSGVSSAAQLQSDAH
jgi:diguanylate cyclase (GGDEF)-like protein